MLLNIEWKYIEYGYSVGEGLNTHSFDSIFFTPNIDGIFIFLRLANDTDSILIKKDLNCTNEIHGFLNLPMYESSYLLINNYFCTNYSSIDREEYVKECTKLEKVFLTEYLYYVKILLSRLPKKYAEGLPFYRRLFDARK